VLLAHGYMSSRNSELLVRLSTALARSCQLSSFRFDFSGNGESEGEFRYGQYRCDSGWRLSQGGVWDGVGACGRGVRGGGELGVWVGMACCW
jgi:hypothetical protein